MNALDLVKAIKSATGDFGKFWTNLYDITRNLPKVFESFGNWGADRLNLTGRDQYKENTDAAFKSIKTARESK